MPYKQISYKHYQEGETIDVSFTREEMINSGCYEIRKVSVQELNDDEKDQLLESMCIYLEKLEESNIAKRRMMIAR